MMDVQQWPPVPQSVDGVDQLPIVCIPVDQSQASSPDDVSCPCVTRRLSKDSPDPSDFEVDTVVDSSSSSSTATKPSDDGPGMSKQDKASGTKIGRKGDPRMHRAVAARLKDPSISLFLALKIGGFQYENDLDPSAVDSENVTLTQRKNQLSRRVRQARKQHQISKQLSHHTQFEEREARAAVKAAQEATRKAQSAEAATGQTPDDLSLTQQSVVRTHEATDQTHDSASDSRTRTDVPSVSGTTLGKNVDAAEQVANGDSAHKRIWDSTGLDEVYDSSELARAAKEVENDASAKRAKVAKEHPDYAPLIVGPGPRRSFSSLANSIVSKAAAAGEVSTTRTTTAGRPGLGETADAASQGLHAVHTPGAADRTAGLAPPAMSHEAHLHLLQQQQQQYHASPLSFGPLGIGGAAHHLSTLPGVLGHHAFAVSPYASAASTSLFPPPGSNTVPRPSAVAISSLSTTAQKAGMTLEQLAMTLSNVTNLSKVVAECAEDSEDSLRKKKKIAHQLYRLEVRSLYSKCMLAAGIDESMCREESSTHLQFALDAWQEEGKRLKDKMPKLKSSFRSIARNNSGSINLSASSVLGDDADDDILMPRDQDSAASAPRSRRRRALSEERGGERVSFDGPLDHIHDHARAHSHSGSHSQASNAVGDAAVPDRESRRHVHDLKGRCGHRPILHQPKDGAAHIDFVIGDKIECYHGIEPVIGESRRSVWPSKYHCEELEEDCGHTRKSSRDALSPPPPFPLETLTDRAAEPKIIPMSEINLTDGEWNVDIAGTIDDSITALFRLSETDDLPDV